jgi:hypothetical protein
VIGAQQEGEGKTYQGKYYQYPGIKISLGYIPKNPQGKKQDIDRTDAVHHGKNKQDLGYVCLLPPKLQKLSHRNSFKHLSLSGGQKTAMVQKPVLRFMSVYKIGCFADKPYISAAFRLQKCGFQGSRGPAVQVHDRPPLWTLVKRQHRGRPRLISHPLNRHNAGYVPATGAAYGDKLRRCCCRRICFSRTKFITVLLIFQEELGDFVQIFRFFHFYSKGGGSGSSIRPGSGNFGESRRKSLPPIGAFGAKVLSWRDKFSRISV